MVICNERGKKRSYLVLKCGGDEKSRKTVNKVTDVNIFTTDL